MKSELLLFDHNLNLIDLKLFLFVEFVLIVHLFFDYLNKKKIKIEINV